MISRGHSFQGNIFKIQYFQGSFIHRVLSAFISFSFILTLMIPPQAAAQIAPQTLLNLPAPGSMLPLSNGFHPAIIKGLKVDDTNPLLFDFIVDHGEGNLSKDAFRDEAERLVKYFLTSLTVPDQDLWVNLSPYEKDRIIPDDFGVTEMGRDMLAQDYLLKQLTASLLYPEDELGQKFWSSVYQKAQEQFGTTEVPVNTFNKVWIVPESAVVWEHEGIVYVVERKLKVMLEEDYLALKANMNSTDFGMAGNTKEQNKITSGISSEVVREIVIPAIEKEVNEGEHFAQLRQIYNSMILATWYKKNLKDSLLGQVYFDQNKVKGVDIEDREQKLKIYNQYLEAFKTGVFDYVREDVDVISQDVHLRKYFSGGVTVSPGSVLSNSPATNYAGLTDDQQLIVGGSSAGSSGVTAALHEDINAKDGSVGFEKYGKASSSAGADPATNQELTTIKTKRLTLLREQLIEVRNSLKYLKDESVEFLEIALPSLYDRTNDATVVRSRIEKINKFAADLLSRLNRVTNEDEYQAFENYVRKETITGQGGNKSYRDFGGNILRTLNVNAFNPGALLKRFSSSEELDSIPVEKLKGVNSERLIVLRTRLKEIRSLINYGDKSLLKEKLPSLYQLTNDPAVVSQRIKPINDLLQEIDFLLGAIVLAEMEGRYSQSMESYKGLESYLFEQALYNIEEEKVYRVVARYFLDVVDSPLGQWGTLFDADTSNPATKLSSEQKFRAGRLASLFPKMLDANLGRRRSSDGNLERLNKGVMERLATARETGSFEDVKRYLFQESGRSELGWKYTLVALNALRVLADGFEVSVLDDRRIYILERERRQLLEKQLNQQLLFSSPKENVDSQGVGLTVLSDGVNVLFEAAVETGSLTELLQYLAQESLSANAGPEYTNGAAQVWKLIVGTSYEPSLIITEDVRAVSSSIPGEEGLSREDRGNVSYLQTQLGMFSQDSLDESTKDLVQRIESELQAAIELGSLDRVISFLARESIKQNQQQSSADINVRRNSTVAINAIKILVGVKDRKRLDDPIIFEYNDDALENLAHYTTPTLSSLDDIPQNAALIDLIVGIDALIASTRADKSVVKLVRRIIRKLAEYEPEEFEKKSVGAIYSKVVINALKTVFDLHSGSLIGNGILNVIDAQVVNFLESKIHLVANTVVNQVSNKKLSAYLKKFFEEFQQHLSQSRFEGNLSNLEVFLHARASISSVPIVRKAASIASDIVSGKNSDIASGKTIEILTRKDISDFEGTPLVVYDYNEFTVEILEKQLDAMMTSLPAIFESWGISEIESLVEKRHLEELVNEIKGALKEALKVNSLENLIERLYSLSQADMVMDGNIDFDLFPQVALNAWRILVGMYDGELAHKGPIPAKLVIDLLDERLGEMKLYNSDPELLNLFDQLQPIMVKAHAEDSIDEIVEFVGAIPILEDETMSPHTRVVLNTSNLLEGLYAGQLLTGFEDLQMDLFKDRDPFQKLQEIRMDLLLHLLEQGAGNDPDKDPSASSNLKFNEDERVKIIFLVKSIQNLLSQNFELDLRTELSSFRVNVSRLLYESKGYTAELKQWLESESQNTDRSLAYNKAAKNGLAILNGEFEGPLLEESDWTDPKFLSASSNLKFNEDERTNIIFLVKSIQSLLSQKLVLDLRTELSSFRVNVSRLLYKSKGNTAVLKKWLETESQNTDRSPAYIKAVINSLAMLNGESEGPLLEESDWADSKASSSSLSPSNESGVEALERYLNSSSLGEELAPIREKINEARKKGSTVDLKSYLFAESWSGDGNNSEAYINFVVEAFDVLNNASDEAAVSQFEEWLDAQYSKGSNDGKQEFELFKTLDSEEQSKLVAALMFIAKSHLAVPSLLASTKVLMSEEYSGDNFDVMQISLEGANNGLIIVQEDFLRSAEFSDIGTALELALQLASERTLAREDSGGAASSALELFASGEELQLRVERLKGEITQIRKTLTEDGVKKSLRGKSHQKMAINTFLRGLDNRLDKIAEKGVLDEEIFEFFDAQKEGLEEYSYVVDNTRRILLGIYLSGPLFETDELTKEQEDRLSLLSTKLNELLDDSSLSLSVNEGVGLVISLLIWQINDVYDNKIAYNLFAKSLERIMPTGNQLLGLPRNALRILGGHDVELLSNKIGPGINIIDDDSSSSSSLLSIPSGQNLSIRMHTLNNEFDTLRKALDRDASLKSMDVAERANVVRFIDEMERRFSDMRDSDVFDDSIIEFLIAESQKSTQNSALVANTRRILFGIFKSGPLLELETINLLDSQKNKLSELRTKLQDIIRKSGVSPVTDDVGIFINQLVLDVRKTIEGEMPYNQLAKSLERRYPDRKLEGVPLKALLFLGGHKVELLGEAALVSLNKRTMEVLGLDNVSGRGVAANEAVSSAVGYGGIDFNSELLNLQIKRDGKGVPLPVWEQPLDQMNIEGFVPVIINITPVNMPLLLGITDDGIEDPIKVSFKRSFDPLARHWDLIPA